MCIFTTKHLFISRLGKQRAKRSNEASADTTSEAMQRTKWSHEAKPIQQGVSRSRLL